MLAGVEIDQETESMDSVEGLSKSNPTKVKFTEIGVFKGDKLVGWMDETDSRAAYNIIGRTKDSMFFVDYDENTHVSLNIVSNKPQFKVSLSDGKPLINVMLSYEMSINALTGKIDFTDKENVSKLNSIAKEKMIALSNDVLFKAQNEFKSDIFGFGESIHRAYPKVWNELKNNWGTEFSQLQVHFMADTTIMDIGESLRPIINTEE